MIVRDGRAYEVGATPDWDGLRQDLKVRIDALQAAWPDIHKTELCEQLVVPALMHLAAFCELVNVEDESSDEGSKLQ